jgi:hypothetical protein
MAGFGRSVLPKPFLANIGIGPPNVRVRLFAVS